MFKENYISSFDCHFLCVFIWSLYQKSRAPCKQWFHLFGVVLCPQRGLQCLVWEVNCDTTSQHPSPLQGFTLAPSEPLSSPTGTTEHDD